MTDLKFRDIRAVNEALEAARFGDASDEQQTTLRDEVLHLREYCARIEDESARRWHEAAALQATIARITDDNDFQGEH